MGRNNSFVLYKDSENLIKLLSDDQSGKLFKAIFRYVDDGEAPELDEVSTVVFMAIKNYLDRDRDKYEAVCQKRAEYGRKGGEAKATKSKQKLPKATKSKQDVPSVADSESDSESDNDSVSDSESVSESDSERKDSPSSKKVRHKYGSYKNVLLTDDDLQKLQSEFPDWEKRIEALSEYIAMKGDKYKSHIAVIRKWAKSDSPSQKKGVRADVNSEQRKDYIQFEDLFSGQ